MPFYKGYAWHLLTDAIMYGRLDINARFTKTLEARNVTVEEWAKERAKEVEILHAKIKELEAVPGALDALKAENKFDSGDWSGFAINKEDPNYTAQIFAGIGIDFLFIAQGTLNVSFDVVNQIWAGGLSLRVKF